MDEINEVLDSKRELDTDRITKYLLVLKFWNTFASKPMMFAITLLMFLFWTYIIFGLDLIFFLLSMLFHLLFYELYIKKEIRKMEASKKEIKSAIKFFKEKKSNLRKG